MPDISSESVFILVFLLISFLSWLTEKVKASRSAPSDDEQPRPRVVESPPALPRHHRPPATEESRQQRPGDTMREILQSLGVPIEEEVEEPKATPPPLPKAVNEVPPPLEIAKAARKKTGPALSMAEKAALKKIQAGSTPLEGKEGQRRQGQGSTSVRALLQRRNIRSALILKEILDRPKCLHDIE